MTAIANGPRSTATLSKTLSDLYNPDATGAPKGTPYISNYNDITSGKAGKYSAGPGWDFVTGLGSPKVASLYSDLDSATVNP